MILYTIPNNYNPIFVNLEDAIKALDERFELKWFDTDHIKMEKEPFYEGCIELHSVNSDYINPIYIITQELTKNKIPYTLKVFCDGLQIRFPWNDGDISCYKFSQGSNFGNVESRGCPWDDGEDITTCLSLKEAVTLISEWYKEVN